MPNWKKVITSGSSAELTSLYALSITGSLLGTASYATQTLSSSVALTASYTPNAIITASVSSNTITFTKGNGSTFPLTINTGSGGSAFPYTGTAVITGSLIVSGSVPGQPYGINSAAGRLSVNSIDTVSWGDLLLIDPNTGNTSVAWGGRVLIDSGNIIRLDWENGVTHDSTSKDSINWQNRQLIDSAGTTTVDWENTQIYDSSTNLSINWSQRRLYDSAGATILDWENGSFSGNATTATTATSASFASTASYINSPINQSLVLTGSLRGEVTSIAIVSNTASINLARNNFFTITLANGANTHINPTGIAPGQTVNIRVTQGSAGTGTVSFAPAVSQASGSAYTGSQVANAVDIVTMITFDTSKVYVSSIRNMI